MLGEDEKMIREKSCYKILNNVNDRVNWKKATPKVCGDLGLRRSRPGWSRPVQGDLGPSEVISPGDLSPSEVISPGDLGPCPVPDVSMPQPHKPHKHRCMCGAHRRRSRPVISPSRHQPNTMNTATNTLILHCL